MEKILVVTIVFASIGFLIWSVINAFKGKGLCSGCIDHSKSDRGKYGC